MTQDFTTPGDCPQEFSATRCWKATDDCANDSDECCQTITVVDDTPPTVTCPDDIDVCDGETVNFTPPGCSDDCGSCTVTCTRDDELELSDAYPVGDTVITCHADDACGTRTSCSTTVTVNPNPTCTVDPPVVANELTGSISGGTGPYTCSASVTGNGWSVDSCTVTGSDYKVLYTVTQPANASATFSITITDDETCTGGCETTLLIQVGCTVEPLGQAVCEGDPAADFCVVPTGGIAPYTYLWDSGDTTICFTPPTDAAGTFDYCVVVTDALGFNSPPCCGRIVVNGNPTCDVTPQSAETCDGEPRTFCAAPTSGTSPYAVVWTDSSGAVVTTVGDCSAIGAGEECCITVTVGDTYTATVTDAEDCTGSCSATLTTLDCACRVTGGGVDGTVPPRSWVEAVDTNDHYTFGGQVGAPSASSDGDGPWGEWTHRQHRGEQGRFTFHAGTASAPEGTEIAWIQCHDPDNCNPARPAPNKQLDFGGIGSFSNIKKGTPVDDFADSRNRTLHYFEVHIEDLGEPGNQDDAEVGSATCPYGGHAGLPAGDEKCACPDFYTIRIHETTNPASNVMYEILGYINGGNLQLHPPIE